jgi:hypothetical protein
MKKVIALAVATTLFSFVAASDGQKGDLKFKGWVDVYYQYDFNHSSLGTSLVGREFDNKAGTFELANAAINLNYSRKGLPFSVVLDLGLGRNVQINNGLDGANGNRNQIFQQFYVSIPLQGGSSLDLGKFNTWIGSESVYTVDNPNYSLGTLFWYAQPNWHVGARLYKPLSSDSSATFYAVNGWNETEDTNASKTFGISYSKTMNSKLSTTVGYIGGKEGTNGIALPNAGQSDVHLIDFIASYAVSDRHSILFNADYASSSGANSGHWYGYTFYSNHKLSDSKKASLRFSTIQDPQNLRGAAGSISSWTGTYDMQMSAASTLRLELRYDLASSSMFQNGVSGFSNNRTTLTIAHVLRF